MPLPEDYRVLRNGLLLRVGISTLLVVVGASGLIALLADTGSVVAQPRPQPAADATAAPIVVIGSSTVDPTAVSPADVLAAGLGGVAAPERLDGKTLEAIAIHPVAETSPTDEAAAGASLRERQAADAIAPKLPKGPHLQVGIFALPGNADELKRKLEAAGYPAYIETRVHVGPFANRKEADRMREKLKEQGMSALFIPQ